VRRVLAAGFAEFVDGQALLEGFFVLVRVIIHALALGAFQLHYVVLGHKSIFFIN